MYYSCILFCFDTVMGHDLFLIKRKKLTVHLELIHLIRAEMKARGEVRMKLREYIASHDN